MSKEKMISIKTTGIILGVIMLFVLVFMIVSIFI
ncbi:MAG: hypothetical protein BWX97_01701 [Firmicutes bacterium ADurb.Bin146]|nr:MAG: hypothetical protein BWX97_01701 [Firmicutes bacterium ADurb.Bin146]